MAAPVKLDIEREAGDAYSVELQVDGVANVAGMLGELRIVDLGTLTATATSAGLFVFDPDQIPAVRNAAAGAHVCAFIVDPYGPERRTYGIGTYTLV